MRPQASPTGPAVLLASLLLAWALLSPDGPARASQIEVLDWTLGYQVRYTLEDGPGKTAWTAEMRVMVDDFRDVFAYCVDLKQTISQGTPYQVALEDPRTHNISTLQAAWLLGRYSPGLHLAPSDYSERAAITALQVAIWEVIYDHADLDLDSGTFVLQNVLASESVVIRQLALAYLQSLPPGLSSTGLAFAIISRDPKHQDLVLGAAPEPGSLCLTGSALAAGWLLRRRRLA